MSFNSTNTTASQPANAPASPRQHGQPLMSGATVTMPQQGHPHEGGVTGQTPQQLGTKVSRTGHYQKDFLEVFFRGGEIGGRGRCEVGANFTGCAIFRIEYFINNIMVKDTYFSKWNCLTQDSTRVGRQQLYIYMQLFQELQ